MNTCKTCAHWRCEDAGDDRAGFLGDCVAQPVHVSVRGSHGCHWWESREEKAAEGDLDRP